MYKKTTHQIESTKQLKEIISPARNELRLAMEMLGPSTVAELAEHTGRSPESLYYHIRKLESVGLVVKCDPRISHGHEEAVYRMCADRVRVNTEIRRPLFVEALIRGVKTLIRYGDRCLSRALASTETTLKGKRRECRLVQVTARLSPSKIKELNQKMLELEDFLESSDDKSANKHFVVTLILSPAIRDAND